MIDSAAQDKVPIRIAVLEDCSERRAAMQDCLSDRFPQYGVVFFQTAFEMIMYLKRDGANELLLISLDHDLEPQPGQEETDPGCGRDIADCLSEMQPTCPVIIHTTNAPAGVGMETVLDESGWTTIRIVPYDGQRWIGQTWFRAVRNAIVRSVETRSDLPV